MPVFGMGQAAGRPGMGAPQMNETYAGPKPAAWRPPPGMGPPPPRPAGVAGPMGAGAMPPQQAQMQHALKLRQAAQAAGARPDQFGGGKPPPTNMPAPGGGQQFGGALAQARGMPPPAGMGMQAAGFAPRQPMAGQFAQRFPGAKPPPPPMGGGAFGMRPPAGGGGQFGMPTKRPMATGQFPRMGGGMSPYQGGSQR
jgi:hypothetical protein